MKSVYTARDFPIGPEKLLGPVVAPSKYRNRSCRLSSLASNKHTIHYSVFCTNSSSR